MSKKAKGLKPPDTERENKPLKDAIEGALLPFVALTLVAGSVIGAVAKGTELIALYYENPVLYGLLVAIAVALVLLTGINLYSAKIPKTRLRWVRLVAVVTIASIYLLTVTYTEWCGRLGLCGPAIWRPASFLRFDVAHAAERVSGRDLIIQDVAVDRSRSSFSMSKTDESIHALREEKVRTSIEFDRRLIGIFEGATCRSVDGEQPIEDALPIWRDLLKKRGQTVLAARLSDYDGYRTLIKTGGDTIFKALPNASELAATKKDNVANFNIIMRWLSNCVGLADPVLIWTLKDNSDRDLLLINVAYDVLDIGQFAGGGPTPVEPIDVETHDLIHAIGVQNQALDPRVSVPAMSIASIRIRYRLQADRPGLSWLVRATFEASDGTRAASDEIKIFSAKNPSRFK